MQLIENFLNEKDFLNLKNFLYGGEIGWYYRPFAVDEKDYPYFTFCFFNNDTIYTNAFDLIKPLLKKLNHSSLIGVRANLVLNQEKPSQQGWHTDYPYKNFKTAIFYLNECNGPTVVKKEKNVKVYPKENKILIMNGDTEHSMITQTNAKRRIVVNINYYEK